MNIRKFVVLLWLSMCCFQPASAQGARMVNNPAEHFIISPGGVDLRTGRYVYEDTDLSGGTLSLKRTMPEAIRSHNNSFGNFSSNWDIMLTVYPWETDGLGGMDYRATIHSRGLTKTFDSASYHTGYGFRSDGKIEYLTYTGGARTAASTIYTYTASDGTVIVFRPIGGKDCSAEVIWTCAFASSITEPDGTKYTLSYDATGETGGNYVRLSSVVSSRGYALIFEGATGTGGLGSRITKACVVNLTLMALPSFCPSNALATATYAYSGTRLTGVTKPDGATDSFSYFAGGDGEHMQFTKAGQPTPWLTNVTATTAILNEEDTPIEVVRGQYFADGRSYGYIYTANPIGTAIAGGSYVDNVLGTEVAVPYDFPVTPGTGSEDYICQTRPCQFPMPEDFTYVYQQTPGPVSITDGVGRTTTFEYCDPIAAAGLPYYYVNRCMVVPLVSFTDPEGVKTEFTYDGARNITQVRRKAKPGSGLPDIVTSATYSCTNPRICGKPLTQTDAKGQVTTYTYKAETGDLLTETKPVDANGIQAVTRNEYAQFYAWISNGSGGYVQAAEPIWLISATRTCRTTATVSNACAGGSADEVVTAYEYQAGNATAPSNLLLKGMTVTADGQTLRTCYRYDDRGRKISETKPAAGLTVCP
ncbi:hypothetical protein [Sphingomonas sp. G-3-2-10]|uniref:hypothetical protein n=1 Tax=Sphingomonas sp. G-3-2-10 TaxID=2728838 RepID=UPI00146B5179|nr:hypothetical protein [Sphingomonas sp. G-3-2-10]NML05967.1 hypothetical protein [Sphingomonas sp. G-3-2-10]